MTPFDRARLSLDGLSVGDALGERFFGAPAQARGRIEGRWLPSGPWRYTDDTEMALSVVEVLGRHGRIDPDELAHAFARRYDYSRGYGGGARALLQAIRDGGDWRDESRRMFGGGGSYGNGAAMRVAPVGAYFADDLEQVKENARLSALPTHAHPEGMAGAVAVAVAAALAWRVGSGQRIEARDFLEGVASHLPDSEVRQGVERAMTLEMPEHPPSRVASILGSGQRISAQDTVPFTVWCAAHFLGSYEEAFWATASGLGDRDTTCAIVGGIVALSDRTVGIPPTWLQALEPLAM